MNENSINTTLWERSSDENWFSPTSDSLQMLKNLNHDYIVSDIDYSNYKLSASVSVLSGDDDGVGVVFDYADESNYKYIMYQGGGLGNTIYLDTNGQRSAIVLVEVSNGVHKTIAMNSFAPFWSVNTTFEFKLENIFDDVFLYVDDNLLLKYKKENSMSGKIGFVTYSQIANFDNITIEEPLVNRAKSKYVLFAVSNSDTQTEIEVSVGENSDKETSIIPRAIGISDKETLIDIKYRGNLDALVEIQPIGHQNIEAEIEVRPHNRMTAIYEVQQPPIITSVFNPTQDSFTRENTAFETINYGGNSSMVAGISGDDIWRSFIQFDLESINPSYTLTESYLRLYYKGAVPSHLKLDIFNNDKAWQEYSITNLNRPNPIEIISNEFTVNSSYGYIEFDVLKIVEDWVAKRAINNGFLLRVSNETVLGQVIFNTRESMFPPELIVKHYDSRIFSQGKSQIFAEIIAMNRGNLDALVEIEPSSIFSKNDILSEIYCHQVDVPLDSDVEVEVTVTKPYVFSEFVVAINEYSEILASIDSRVSTMQNMETTIFVSRPFACTEVFSKYNNSVEAIVISKVIGHSVLDTEISVTRTNTETEITVTSTNDIPCEITVALDGNSSVDSEITINRKEAIAEIFVPYKNDVDSEILIRAIEHSSKDTEIHISKPFTLTEITPFLLGESEVLTEICVSKSDIWVEVKYAHKGEDDVLVELEANDVFNSSKDAYLLVSKDSVKTEIVARVEGRQDVYTVICVTRPSENAEITISYRSDVWVEIEPNIKSDTLVEILVSKDTVKTEISVYGYENSDINTELTSKVFSQVQAEIFVSYTSNIDIEIDANSVSQVYVEIVSNKPNVHSQIVIPTWVDHDMPTEIEPRILMVSNVYTVIQIGSAGGAYAFII